MTMTPVVRLFVSLLLALCLPLQTVAAATMPFCGADHEGSAMAAGAMAHTMATEHAHHDMGDGSADGHEPQGGLGCNQCGLCHLACASTLPSRAPDVSDVLRAVYQSAPVAAAKSFKPDPVLKPPRG